ncbi:MAG: response regulator transcription factor [Parafilimonas sp.]|nr:response regulator transcription factor [Parafilimonas sp.]
MKTLIIEDEPKNIKILKHFIADYLPNLQIVGEASNVEKAQELYNGLTPDLMFLDIQLSNGTAFDFLDKIIPVSCAIVFITAYNDYAIKAFKYSAVDYLLKPVNINDLISAVKKAEQKIAGEKINIQLQTLLENINNPLNNKIALPVEGKLIFIGVNDIMYCKAIGVRTIIYDVLKHNYVTSKSIGEYEEILPNKSFFRIHNSYLVNINFIAKYVKGRGGFIEMHDGTNLEVAARRKDEFLSRFNS